MKIVNVVCAIIIDNNRCFATQRGYGDFKGGWEFPGGKIEEGETEEEALKREIKEELDTDIEIKEYFGNIEYDYPSFHLSMKCYICTVIKGDLHLIEHISKKWLSKDELDSISWLPADFTIIEKLKKYLK